MRESVGYRPDIDGLRAVAVVLVVLYHLGVGFTKGGFVGVDVFFVISGFLITRIIVAEAQSGHFSLLGFYERRVRRLFPTLFVVLIFSAAMGYFVLFPPEYEYFGATLAAAVFFVANILFYNGSGYFDGTREVVPLLHTWSLAVEEQFYLLYPLALVPLLRWGNNLASRTIFAIAALSFVLCVVLVAHDRSAAFFLLPSRAWELLVGSLLALGAFPAIRDPKLRMWLSAFGLVLILIAAGATTRNVPFPGWAALVPCLGAALIIHAGAKADTPVYRLLSTRAFVFIGLISYSLYLWHWPLIVFYKAYFGFPSRPEKALLGLASIAIAALSWRYIETPFRQRKRFPGRKQMFLTAALGSAAATTLALLLVATEGMSNRFPENLRRLASFKYNPTESMRDGSCFISKAFAHRSHVDAACLRLDGDRRNVLLVGDSHAAHYWAGLTVVFPDINFLQATASGCPPVFDGGGSARCRAVVDGAYQNVIPGAKLDAVVIAADWSYEDVPRLKETVEYLKSHVGRVYVFGPIVTYNDLLPRLLTRSEWFQDSLMVDQLREDDTPKLDQAMSASSSARYVSIYKVLCGDGDACTTRDQDGDPIQFDRAHLTRMGSIIVARALAAQGVFSFE